MLKLGDFGISRELKGDVEDASTFIGTVSLPKFTNINNLTRSLV